MGMASQSNYVKVASYEGRKGEVKRVVLLYSGGLDTSTMLKWIQDEYGAEVIALTIDLGQATDDLEAVKKKALMLGAKKALVIDARDEFAEEYLAKSIKANGMYQGKYYMATCLGRPLLAKWAVKVAAQEGADAIAHGCTGKGSDQVRIEGSALALNPDIKIIAPVREWGMGRAEQIAYAKEHGIPVKQTMDKPYSYDENMWGSSGEGGEIENPALIPPLDKILQLTTLPEHAPNKPEFITIEFEKGLPVAVDDKQMKLADLIAHLNTKAAKHGIGISVILEDRIIGMKIRDVYEAPAAETIITAHKTLEGYTATARETEFKATVDQKWGYLCYGALWFEPLMDNLNAFIDKSNEKVTGKVTMKLYKGVAEALAIETPNTIFDEKLATFMNMNNDNFNQNASAGFIEHYTMQMRLAQRRQRTALLAIGGQEQKRKLLSCIQQLNAWGYQLYATAKTHKFLNDNGISAIFVSKISDPAHKPNLADLLDAKRFDIIINIPKTDHHDDTDAQKTDGQIIREKAVATDTPLITTVSVAQEVIAKLAKAKV